MILPRPKIYDLLGGIVGFSGLALVIHRLYAHSSLVPLLNLGIGQFSQLTLLVGLSALSIHLLTVAWRGLLEHLGAWISADDAFRIYGYSLISRYVPGNVFQFVSRQLLSVKIGVPGRAAIQSSIWEVSLIACAGVALAPFCLPGAVIGIGGWVASFIGVGLWLAGRLTLILAVGPKVAHAYFLQSLYLMSAGILFVCTVHVVLPGTIGWSAVLRVIGAYVVAWLGGLLVPGAPAGIGVREFLLMLFLRGVVPDGGLLVVLTLGRMVAMIGDVVYFLAAFIWVRKEAAPSRQDIG